MRLIHSLPLSFLASGLVIVLCLCTACVFGPSTSGQPANPSATDVGIVPIASNYLNKSFTLEEAASAVADNYQNQVNGSLQNPTFYYIKGENVDESGKAERWIFGARVGNSTSMLIYDSTGASRITWQGLLPEQVINTASILSPASIIKIAYPENQNITGDLQLEINNGEYTVTAPSGSHPQEYRINATTGVLIATYA